MDSAVETFGLTKSYGSAKALVKALDGLDLKVRQGEILVLLGPNGSGKTTLLHLLSTVLKPTAGTATVMGHDIVKQPLQVRETIGISFQEPRGFWRHKPYHILSFHAAIYGLSGEERSKVVDQTLKDFELWPSRNKKFMELSGGQGKRLEAAKLFVHRPSVAVFDEPTAMVSLSTVAYPISVISSYFPSSVVTLIQLNPLSQGAEALRTVINNGMPSSSAFNLPTLLVTSLVLLAVGVVSYRHVFTKLRDVGKLQ